MTYITRVIVYFRINSVLVVCAIHWKSYWVIYIIIVTVFFRSTAQYSYWVIYIIIVTVITMLYYIYDYNIFLTVTII